MTQEQSSPDPLTAWWDRFDELLEDYAGARAETAVFNVTQRSGMTVRMGRPRLQALREHVSAALASREAAVPPQPDERAALIALRRARPYVSGQYDFEDTGRVEVLNLIDAALAHPAQAQQATREALCPHCGKTVNWMCHGIFQQPKSGEHK